MASQFAVVASPSLPAPVHLGLALVFCGVLVVALYLARGTAPRFVIAALWLRYMMSAFPDISYASVAAGLSLNALGSAGVIGVGLLLIDFRRLRWAIFLPFYLMLAIICASALMNAMPFAAIDTLLKWLYLIVVLMVFLKALEGPEPDRFILLLLAAFVPPLGFQFASVALGVAKASEADGSASYIGGYNHEAAFSIILLTLVFVVSICTRLRTPGRLLGIAIGVAGILLANYRTTLMAAAPIAAYQFVAQGVRSFVPRQRFVVFCAMFPAAILVFMAFADALAERFSDIGAVLDSGGALLQTQNEFDAEEQALFSGRIYIWSGYVTSYLQGSQLQLLLGLGPDSWEAEFPHYAHNTVISYLYEYGLFGAAAVVSVWLTFLVRALRAPAGLRGSLLSAHASFLILNMATMPHWLIEGDILYALICGYTLYATRSAPAAAPRLHFGAAPFPYRLVSTSSRVDGPSR